MDHDEQTPGRRREDVPDDQPQEGRERSPGGDFGLGDYAGLLGNPNTAAEASRVRLRCPEPGCDQIGSAADYRQSYWPKCRRHHVRMVRVEVG